MNESLKYVRFDWAAKRMLRDKANFGVLEGLVTVLLNEPIKIVEILESESNQESASDKYNRVDIKAKNSKDEIIIVEIQLTREIHYLERILYGVSKAITEHISLGDRYEKVKKVYSINVLYFDLGEGDDYLYHGKTVFEGVHTKDILKVTNRERTGMGWHSSSNIFPEYFIIRVNEFNKIATTPLEEWIDYLKTGTIKENTTTPGLEEARKKLKYLMMSQSEQKAYVRHLENIMDQNEMFDTAHREGKAEGLAEGFEKGKAQGVTEGEILGIKKTAKGMKADGIPAQTISRITGLSIEDIEKL